MDEIAKELKNKQEVDIKPGENQPEPVTVRLMGEDELRREPDGAFVRPAKAVKRHFAGLWDGMKFGDKAAFFLSCLILAYGVLPILFTSTYFNEGSFLIICAGTGLACASLYIRRLISLKSIVLNILLCLAGVVISAGIVSMSVISGLMISASLNAPPEDVTNMTVVVLGCRVNGAEPSLMLRERLDAAYDYLLEHPQAYCIVSGGQGDDEPFPEAEVMKNYLVSRGISEKRIIAEPDSYDTRENFENSAAIIEKYGLSKYVVIATDRFHQFRAADTARKLGLHPYAINRETSWYNFGHYWLREIGAIVGHGHLL